MNRLADSANVLQNEGSYCVGLSLFRASRATFAPRAPAFVALALPSPPPLNTALVAITSCTGTASRLLTRSGVTTETSPPLNRACTFGLLRSLSHAPKSRNSLFGTRPVAFHIASIWPSSSAMGSTFAPVQLPLPATTDTPAVIFATTAARCDRMQLIVSVRVFACSSRVTCDPA